MLNPVKNWILFAVMALGALGAWVLRPTHYLADQRPKIELEAMVPKQFGEWQALPPMSGQIVNPQQLTLINKIYADTLSRSYVNPEGKLIMLTIAYGKNQSDGVALHYPEVCYPAQGFTLVSGRKATLDTGYSTIPVKQLFTRLGNRNEPVTYWSTIGDKVVQGGMDTKLTQLQFGFKGYIPDGLLFRVSSLAADTPEAYALHASFVKTLASALTLENKSLLMGRQ
jgi:EpsI family protein